MTICLNALTSMLLGSYATVYTRLYLGRHLPLSTYGEIPSNLYYIQNCLQMGNRPASSFEFELVQLSKIRLTASFSSQSSASSYEHVWYQRHANCDVLPYILLYPIVYHIADQVRYDTLSLWLRKKQPSRKRSEHRQKQRERGHAISQKLIHIFWSNVVCCRTQCSYFFFSRF